MVALDTVIAGALSHDPAHPLITYYDDSTGERVELSATTMANWVAKTANLLQDEFGVARGDQVGVLLPAHWQTAAILLAAWRLGAVVTGDPAGTTVSFCTADRLADAAVADEVVALALLPLGRAFPAVPAGAQDFAAIIPGQADDFAAYDPPQDRDQALADGTTGAGLAVLAHQRANALGIRATDRILSTLAWTDPDDWVTGLLAPVARGASLVQAVGADPDTLADRCTAEMVTATLGDDVPGVRRLDSGVRVREA